MSLPPPPEADGGPPALTFLARLTVTCAPAVDLGPAEGAGGAGRKVMIPITGGHVQGPHLNGAVIPGGADWATRRPDGTTRVWARYALRLDDGTVVGVTNAGTVLAPVQGLRTGRTAASLDIPDGPHAWLRDRVILGTLDTRPEAEPGVIRIGFFLVA